MNLAAFNVLVGGISCCNLMCASMDILLLTANLVVFLQETTEMQITFA